MFIFFSNYEKITFRRFISYRLIISGIQGWFYTNCIFGKFLKISGWKNIPNFVAQPVVRFVWKFHFWKLSLGQNFKEIDGQKWTARSFFHGIALYYSIMPIMPNCITFYSIIDPIECRKRTEIKLSTVLENSFLRYT